jgi:hypothetical protein
MTSSSLVGNSTGEVAWLGAFQYFDDVIGCAARIFGEADPIANEATVIDVLSETVHSWQPHPTARAGSLYSFDATAMTLPLMGQ